MVSTWSSCVELPIQRLFLGIAASKSLKLYGGDAKDAYAHAPRLTVEEREENHNSSSGGLQCVHWHASLCLYQIAYSGRVAASLYTTNSGCSTQPPSSIVTATTYVWTNLIHHKFELANIARSATGRLRLGRIKTEYLT